MNELELIRAVLPAEDGPSHENWAQTRATLVEALAEPGDARIQRPAIRRRRLLSTVGVAGTLATILVGATLAFVLHGGAVRPGSASAAGVLRRAAAAALTSPPPHLTAGQWWYSENVGTYLDTIVAAANKPVTAYVSETETYWIADGRWVRRDQLRSITATIKSLPKSELRDFRANPSLNEHNNDADLPVSYAKLLDAPTDTAGLSKFVLSAETAPGFRVAAKNKAFVMVNAIHDILIEPMVPGRLRSALFRVAATIPGAHLLGRVQDGLGRPAIAIGFDVPDQDAQYEFLFDPKSYVLLDLREVNLKNPRVPWGDTEFIHSGLVHRVGASPATKPKTG